MRKKLLLGILHLLVIYIAKGQQLNPDGTIIPPKVRSCATAELFEMYKQKDPFLGQLQQEQEQMIYDYNHGPNANKTTSSEIIIPVVVHVLNKGEPIGTGTNISDAQIDSQIVALNRHFSNSNMNMRFCLATNLPSGSSYQWANGKKGVTRIHSFASSNKLTINGTRALQSVVSFPHEKYVNIWVVSSICDKDDGQCSDTAGVILGYSMYPLDKAGLDGIVVRSDVMGNNSTGGNFNLFKGYDRGNVLVHEFGHYFNLYHTFQGGCGDAVNCETTGDYICETPPQAFSLGYCAVNASNEPNCTGTWTTENFMDYAPNACLTHFVPEQRDKRILPLLTINPFRRNLVSAENLAEVGVICVNQDLTAFFKSDKQYICANDTVTYESFQAPSGTATAWKWTFEGGTPNSATGQGPIKVVYANSGIYDVKLEAYNATDTVTNTKIDYTAVDKCNPIFSENANWDFGTRLALDFSSGVPKKQTTNINFQFCSAIISNPTNNQAILRSNGYKVFDGNYKLITDSLIGLDSALGGFDRTSGVAICKKPLSSDHYYVFYPTVHYYDIGGHLNHGLRYTTIDVSKTNANGAQGDIYNHELNKLMPGDLMPTTEAVSIIPGTNENEYWVVSICSRGAYKGKFVSYKVHSGGIDFPVFSDSFDDFFYEQNRDMKIAPNGKWLSLSGGVGCKIYRFDRYTGKVEYVSYLPASVLLGACFSPNSRFLYTESSNALLQYDLNTVTPCNKEPKYQVVQNSNIQGFKMALGPNKKIYHSIHSQDSYDWENNNGLNAILFPDSLITDAKPNAAGFLAKAVEFKQSVDIGHTWLGMPNDNLGENDTMPDFNFCVENCTNARFLSTRNGSNFKWDFGNGNTDLLNHEESFQQYPFPTVPITYNVTLSMTNIFGTEVSITKPVTLFPNPKPVIAGSQNVCYNGIASPYSVGNLDADTRYIWYISDNNKVDTIESTSINILWEASGNHKVKLVSINKNGCINSDSIIVFVDRITLQLQDKRIVCLGSQSIIKALVGDGVPPFTYQWSPATAVIGSTTNDSLVIQPTGDIDYTLVVTDSLNCERTAKISIIVQSGAVSIIPALSLRKCNGDGDSATASLYFSNAAEPYTYVYNNGITGQTYSNPIIRAFANGTYSVTLTDNCNNTATTTFTISEPSLLILSLTENDGSCNSGSITANAAGGTLPHLYIWSNGETDATISGLANGTYTVTLTDANGCSKTATNILSHSKPSLNIVGPAYSCYDPNPIVLTAVSDDTNLTYLWSNGSTNNSITYDNYPYSSISLFQVTITNSEGCTASVIQPQHPIYNGPLSYFTDPTGIYNGICGQVRVKMYPGYPFTSVLWSTGETSDVLTVGPSGGNFKVTVTNSIGCYYVDSLTVDPFTSVMSAGPDVTICLGASTQLDFITQIASQYNWLPVEGLSDPHIKNPIASPTVTTTYTCTVTQPSAYSDCSATDQVVVTVNPSLLADAGLNQTVCSNYKFTLGGASTASDGTPPYTYAWQSMSSEGNIDDPTQSNPIGTVISTTTFTHNVVFKVTVTDAIGCTASSQSIITVTSPTYTYKDTYATDGNIYAYEVSKNEPSFLSPEPWDNGGVIKIKGNLIITSGFTLTISNGTKVEFTKDPDIPENDNGYPNGALIVEPGGKLVLNNATLSGSSSCNAMWEGVQVLGNSNNNNGQITLKNGAIIEDADVGVALFKRDIPFYPPGTTIPEYGRGEIQSNNAIFRNNGASVQFYGQSLVHNASRIKNTQFICPGPFKRNNNGIASGTSVYIDLQNVYAVGVLGGNIFAGNQPGVTAIRSVDAGYDVVPYTNYPILIGKTRNQFNGLYKGIDAYSSGGTGDKIRIRENDFNGTLQGITVNTTAFNEIVANTFTIPAGTSKNVGYGVYSFGAVGYIATDNTFNNAGTPNQYTYGMIVRNSVASIAREYRNDFEGIFYAASIMEQQNDQLQVGCNQYSNSNLFDWAVTSGNLGAQGACVGAAGPTGNTFGTCVTPGSDKQIHLNPGVPSFDYNSHNNQLPTCFSSTLTGIFGCGSNSNGLSCPNQTPTYTLLPAPPTPCNPCPSITGLIQNILNQLAGITDPILKAIAQNNIIRSLLDNGNVREALGLLGVSGNLNDVKIQVPSYLLQQNCTEAQRVLATIPNLTAEDQAYHQLFDMLTSACQSGRVAAQLSPSEVSIVAQVAAGNTRVAVNAQAVLVGLNKVGLVRTPEPIIANGSSSRFASDIERDNVLTVTIKENTLKAVPNPFSSTTTLSYQLKSAAQAVTLVVLDITGRKIQEFVMGDKQMGDVSFDAGNNHNGMYFCQLWADGKLINIQKLTILK